ncbi:hypothetical protein C8R43DRAFT_251448 [Mycena crocata]|nr:hypothetical protein C8R43DRAFT_251448 [Mycena crocata]
MPPAIKNPHRADRRDSFSFLSSLCLSVPLHVVMPTSMFHTLFSCCIRSRSASVDDNTVIPNETTHLIPASEDLSSPGLPDTIAVDHQKLNDRMSNIVRRQEGKMVNVSSRTPFTLQTAVDRTPGSEAAPISPDVLSPLTPTSSMFPQPPSTPSAATLLSRRPPVLTMTPARSRAGLNLYADSRYSSPSGSRSSSRRRTDSDRYIYSGPPSVIDGRQAKPKHPIPSDWLLDTDSDSPSVQTHSPLSAMQIPSPSTPKEEPPIDPNVQSIAFSWSDK